MVMAPRAVSVGAQMSWVAQHWNSNWVDLSQESNRPEMTQVFCCVCVCHVSPAQYGVWSQLCVCVDEHQCPVKKLNLPNPLHQAQRRWARHVLAEHPGVFLSLSFFPLIHTFFVHPAGADFELSIQRHMGILHT